MFVQDNLLKTATSVGVVSGSLVVFALAVRDSQVLGQPSLLLWSWLALALLLPLSVGGGLLRFRNAYHALPQASLLR